MDVIEFLDLYLIKFLSLLDCEHWKDVWNIVLIEFLDLLSLYLIEVLEICLVFKDALFVM